MSYILMYMVGVLASLAFLFFQVKTVDLPCLAEEWFLSVDSRARNDFAYVAMASYMIDAGWPDSDRVAWLADMASRNLPGTTAPDITVADARGRGYLSLSQLRGRDVVLLFYDHDCRECADLVHDLGRSAVIADAQGSRGLDIVAVDVGADSAEGCVRIPWLWKDCRDVDGRVMDGGEYFIPYTPMVYFIGGDGNIKLKDATVGEIEHVLIHDCGYGRCDHGSNAEIKPM